MSEDSNVSAGDATGFLLTVIDEAAAFNEDWQEALDEITGALQDGQEEVSELIYAAVRDKLAEEGLITLPEEDAQAEGGEEGGEEPTLEDTIDAAMVAKLQELGLTSEEGPSPLETLQTGLETLQTTHENDAKSLKEAAEDNATAITTLDGSVKELQFIVATLRLDVGKIDGLKSALGQLETQVSELRSLIVPSNSADAEADNRAPEELN